MKFFIVLTLCAGVVYAGLIPDFHLHEHLSSMESRLRISVLTNETTEVVDLIKNGVNVVVRYIDGHTPLHLSALMGHAHTAEILANHSKNINVLNDDGLTPLYVAVQNGGVNVVDVLLEKGADPNCRDPKSRKTALHVASELGFEGIVNSLIDNHANVNVRDKNDDLPLDFALRNGHNSIAVKLIESGSDLDSNSGWKVSVLSCLARNDSSPSFKYNLAKNGVDISDKWINSLKEAINKDDMNVTKILIKTCTNDLKEIKEPWPMHLAAFGGFDDIVEFLLKNGGDVNAKDEYGNTPLHWAAFNGQSSIAEILIANGAEVNSKNLKGYSPLHLAAREGKANVTKVLVGKWADVDSRSNKGNTPLHWAAYYGFEDIVRILLEQNSDVSIKNSGGLTAINFAQSKGKTEIITLLQEAADIEAPEHPDESTA